MASSCACLRTPACSASAKVDEPANESSMQGEKNRLENTDDESPQRLWAAAYGRQSHTLGILESDLDCQGYHGPEAERRFSRTVENQTNFSCLRNNTGCRVRAGRLSLTNSTSCF